VLQLGTALRKLKYLPGCVGEAGIVAVDAILRVESRVARNVFDVELWFGSDGRA